MKKRKTKQVSIYAKAKHRETLRRGRQDRVKETEKEGERKTQGMRERRNTRPRNPVEMVMRRP